MNLSTSFNYFSDLLTNYIPSATNCGISHLKTQTLTWMSKYWPACPCNANKCSIFYECMIHCVIHQDGFRGRSRSTLLIKIWHKKKEANKTMEPCLIYFLIGTSPPFFVKILIHLGLHEVSEDNSFNWYSAFVFIFPL